MLITHTKEITAV